MAEESRSGFRNWPLLITSILLAIVVVLIYNIHIAKIRQSYKGRTVMLLKFNRDMNVAEKLKDRDVRLVEVPASAAQQLSDVVDEDGYAFVTTSGLLQHAVQKDQWVLWSHVVRNDKDNPSANISPGKVAFPLEIDPQLAPGTILRVNDLIDVVGILSVNGQPPRAYRIMEAVRVHTIGGMGAKDVKTFGRGSIGDDGLSRYRTITIEVDEKIYLDLTNVLTHVQDSLRIVVRNPAQRPSPLAGKVNPELQDLAGASGIVVKKPM